MLLPWLVWFRSAIGSVVSVCIFLQPVLADEAFSRGQQLFESSGCTACHAPQVKVVQDGENRGFEMPPRSRILTRLRALAAILQDRESMQARTAGHVHDVAQSCQFYRDFAEEYARVSRLVRDGNAAFPMPSWAQRTAAATEVAGDNAADNNISELIDYLLVAEGQSLDKESLARWQHVSVNCNRDVVKEPSASASRNIMVSRPVLLTGDQTRRAEILARLSHLDLQENALDLAPAVSFLSYQNFLFNKIGYLDDGDLDIWVLRQAALDEIFYDVQKILAGNRFPNLVYFVIAVDKSVLPYRSYFFSKPDETFRYIFRNPKRYLSPLTSRNRNAFEDADISGCFECHVSGPLRLRPRRWETIPDLSASDRQLMEAMNRRVLAYGPVTTDWPAGQPQLTEYEREPLRHEACAGCHSETAIRGPVLRYHSKEIVALMNAHEDAQGYYQYNIPKPNVFLMPKNMQTEQPSISQRTLAAMPPLMPLTEKDNAALFEWLGKIKAH